MCGIAGFHALAGRPATDEATLRDMVAALAHRGPDAEGIDVTASAGLGARRLALVDLEHGDQPMGDDTCGIRLVCNGEIFNHRQLRADLEKRGRRFRTHCDIEVIIHLYLEYGEAFLDHLDGQYAIALHDRRTGTLLLARDPFGVCPLFYTRVGGELLFASEIGALLRHPQVTARLDPTGLDQVLMLPGLVSPRTMFAGIDSLPAGHVLVARNGEVRLRQFWDLDYPDTSQGGGLDLPPEALTDMTVAVLARAVSRCLDADVPVGAYLSGGLDSSLVAMLGTTALGGRLPATFSVGYHEAAYDEKKYIDLIAGRVSDKHHHQVLSVDQLVAQLPAVVARTAVPLRETYNAASLYLSRRVSETGMRAVIGGEGADELFAGYAGYRFDALRRHRVLSGDDVPRERDLRRALWGDATLRYEHDLVPMRRRVRGLYSPALRDALPEFDCLRAPLVDVAKLQGRHRLHQRSYLDVKLRLADHLLGDHGDRMAMANSVEMRYPFLSRAMANLACRLDPAVKLRDMQEKAILKDAGRRLLPRAIVDREKFSWSAPGTPSMLRPGALDTAQRDLVEHLLSPEKLRRDGLFDVAAVTALRRSQEHAPLSDPNGAPDLLMVVLTTGLFTDMFLNPSTTTTAREPR